MTALVALFIPIAFLLGIVVGGAWEFSRRGGTYDLLHPVPDTTSTPFDQVDQVLVEDLAVAA